MIFLAILKNIFHVNWLLWLTIKARLFILILWLNNLENRCYNNESLCLLIGNIYSFCISCFLLFRSKTLLLFILWTSLKYQTSTRCTSCMIPVPSCFSSGMWWFWNVTHLNFLFVKYSVSADHFQMHNSILMPIFTLLYRRVNWFYRKMACFPISLVTVFDNKV